MADNQTGARCNAESPQHKAGVAVDAVGYGILTGTLAAVVCGFVLRDGLGIVGYQPLAQGVFYVAGFLAAGSYIWRGK